jgi:hypothetical protein
MRISRHFLFCVNEEEILKIVNICKPYPGVVSRLQDSLVRTTFCACHFQEKENYFNVCVFKNLTVSS